MATANPTIPTELAPGFGSKVRSLARYTKRNPSIIFGACMLLVIVAFWSIGTILTDPDDAKDLAFSLNNRPSLANPHPCYDSSNLRSACLQRDGTPLSYDRQPRRHLLGTDRLGKDIFASLSEGIPQTLLIGLIAGSIGTVTGTLLAFIAGYYGGVIDALIRFVVDTLQTIPGILILIIIAIAWRDAGGGEMTFIQLALIIAMLSWLGPTRVIRSQVLVIKQRSYVEMARLSGMSGPEVIVRELIPNLMPFIVANFVLSVSSAILASVGLEVLGLGDFSSNTLGMMIYHNIWYASLINGWWWWWVPPIVVIVILFVGLFMLSRGMDEWANPRLRRRV
jgi:peptide/nickel transport system permease protein